MAAHIVWNTQILPIRVRPGFREGDHEADEVKGPPPAASETMDQGDDREHSRVKVCLTSGGRETVFFPRGVRGVLGGCPDFVLRTGM